MNPKLWRKFYECNCHTEGIMISYEDDYEKGVPTVDLAFFQHGLIPRLNLSFFERLRWCWYILTKGYPFADQAILDQSTAKELGNDLIEFSNKKYIFGTIETERV